MPQLPQLREIRSASVGAPPNPTITPVRGLMEGLSAIGDASNEYLESLRQKQDERDRIWAQGQVTEARAAQEEARSKRWAEGADLSNLPDQVTTEFDTDLNKRRAAAPSKNAAKYLDLAAPDLRVGFRSQAREDADKYLVTKNFTGLVDNVEKARGLVFNNPGTFAKSYAEQKTLIDSVKMPTELRAKMDAHLKELGSSAVQGMIENGNPYQAAKELKSGAWNNYLNPDRLASLTNAAQGEIKRREAEAKANQAQARAEASIDAAQLIQSDIIGRQTLGKGVSVDDQARIRAGLTDKQWEKYQAEAKRADAVYSLAGDLAKKSNVEIQETLAKSVPKLNADGTAPADLGDQQAAYKIAQGIAQNVMAKRKADPAAAARDAVTNVQWGWEAYANNPEDGNLRVAIKRSLAAQASMGIPADQQKPLPAQMALAIAGDIRSAPAEKAAAKLKEQAAHFGENWPKVFSQIAPHLDANSMWATTLDDKNMAAILLETSRMAGADGKAGSGVRSLRQSLGVPESGVGSLKDMIAQDDDVRDLMTAMSRRGGGGSTAITSGTAIETLATGLMQRNQSSASEATAAAIKAVVTDKYNFGRVNGVPFVTPKAIGADNAEMGARAVLAKIKGDGLDLPGADPGAINADTRAQYVSAVQRNGYWVTLPGNKGLELWAGDAPVTRNGQRMAYTWDQLRARSSEVSSEYDPARGQRVR